MIGSNGVDYSAYLYNSLYACNSLCMNDTLVTLLCIDSNLIDLNVLCQVDHQRKLLERIFIDTAHRVVNEVAGQQNRQ